MLARALACEARTTFFNISSSSITSKYRGDSEKLVRVLFDLARYYAPSTIFIDEVDALMGARDAAGDGEGGEASRRMKSELLIQLDGLAKGEEMVFVLCASNLPWDLDLALLRRLEKRILVPLPEKEARREIVQKRLEEGGRAKGLGQAHGVACSRSLHERDGVTLTSAVCVRADYEWVAQATERFSGSDLVSVCKESAMRPVRRLMKRLMRRGEEANPTKDAALDLEPISLADVKAALACPHRTS